MKGFVIINRLPNTTGKALWYGVNNLSIHKSGEWVQTAGLALMFARKKDAEAFMCLMEFKTGRWLSGEIVQYNSVTHKWKMSIWQRISLFVRFVQSTLSRKRLLA